MEIDLMYDPLDERSIDPAEDPEGWIEEQLRSNKDLAFVPAGDGKWKSRALKMGHVVDIEVSLKDGMVETYARMSMAPENETELTAFRTLAMVENGTFIIRGYVRPELNERLSFGCRQHVVPPFDLNDAIECCLISTSHQAETFERIKNGEDVASAYMETNAHRLKNLAAIGSMRS